jgi:hypothetical protein
VIRDRLSITAHQPHVPPNETLHWLQPMQQCLLDDISTSVGEFGLAPRMNVQSAGCHGKTDAVTPTCPRIFQNGPRAVGYRSRRSLLYTPALRTAETQDRRVPRYCLRLRNCSRSLGARRKRSRRPLPPENNPSRERVSCRQREQPTLFPVADPTSST